MAMEEARRDLQRRLEEVLGKEHAFTLMTQLPRDEPATRNDLERVETSLTERMDLTRTELAERIDVTGSELRTELERVEARLAERIDLKVETAEHRTIAALERSHGDLRKDMVAQSRMFVFSTLTAVVTVGGVAVAAGRVG